MDMTYIMFLLGVLFGTIVTKILTDVKAGHGYFKLVPYKDEEGFYTINVRIPNEQPLDKKKIVILRKEKDDSRK